MKSNFPLRILSWVLLASPLFAQLDFEPQSLVTLPGVNTHYDISTDMFDNWTDYYLCWENQSDSSVFTIYSMVVWPELGEPEIVASSTDSLVNPAINMLGDIVWQHKENGNWVLKHYSSENDSIRTLTNPDDNCSQPSLSRQLVFYVQGDSLMSLNLNTLASVLVDTGSISNPDASPDAYSIYFQVLYEKQQEDTTSIFVAYSGIEHSMHISRLSHNQFNKYPRFGTMGGFTYQTRVDNVWHVTTDLWGEMMEGIVNATKPALLTIPIPVARVVEEYLIFYESDASTDNKDIYAYGLFGMNPVTNISNSPGNDLNPQVTLLSFDKVAVFWEHEVENGREIWWARDSLHISGGAVDGSAAVPKNFAIEQAYPNPFNAAIQIDYSVSSPSALVISIFDLYGKLVLKEIVNQNVGSHSYLWDGDDAMGQSMESGVYIINFADHFQSLSKKLVLIK